MAVRVVSLALVLALQAPPGGEPEWKPIKSSPGGFSVDAPGQSQTMVQTQQGPNGPMKVPMVVSRLGDVAFLALRIPNPNPVPKAQQKAFFDGVRGSFAQGQGKKLVSEKRAEIGGVPAADYVVEAPGPNGQTLLMRARFLLWDENTTFNLQVIAPQGSETEKHAEKFFKTFKTIKVNAAEAKAAPAPGGAGASAPLKWGTFTSDEGGFSVRMPGKPVEQSQTQKTAEGDIVIHMYIVETPTRAFLASYYIFPEKVAKLDDKGKQKGARRHVPGRRDGHEGENVGDQAEVARQAQGPGISV